MAKYNPVNVFAELDTPHRARAAASCSEYAAFALAGMNAFTAALTLLNPRPYETLIGNDPSVFSAAQFVVAALAASVGIILRTQRPLWAAWAIAAWAAIECAPWITGRLYAHAGLFPLNVFVLLLALQGLRGARRLRELSARSGPDGA